MPTKSNPQEQATLRLTLDVIYNLNGVDISELRCRLEDMVRGAMADGLLTGDLEAEVEHHAVAVQVVPDIISAREIADFMLARIEDGEIALEGLPLRMARYGLMDNVSFLDEMGARMEISAMSENAVPRG